MKNSILISIVLLLIIGLSNNSCSQQTELSPEQAKVLAKDAFLFGLPAILIDIQFDFNSYVTTPEGAKAPVNQFAHFREFVDASNRSIVGFNVDNLYSLASLDLTKEPVILSMPDMGDRYWIMQLIDAWNGVPAAPGSRSHGGKAADYVIVGPNWKGELPKGMEVLKTPTTITLIGGRTYCSGTSDYAAVNALQDQYKLTPLSQWGKNYSPPEMVPLKEGFDGTKLVNQQIMMMSEEEYFKKLNQLLVDNPPYETDAAMMKKIELLGIKPGADFSMSNFDSEVVTAIKEGVALGKKEMMAGISNLGESVNNWSLTYDMGRFGTRYAYRASWTLVGVGGNLLEDAFYPNTPIDSEGNAFDGANNYTLTFKKGEVPPAIAFWSLTMYDAESFLVDNEINRYAVGDRSGMKNGDDGSLTIYIQHESPGKDKESNWLPCPPSGLFRIALRLYTPEQRVIDKEWTSPAVEKSKN